jgi:hypothetical protein
MLRFIHHIAATSAAPLAAAGGEEKGEEQGQIDLSSSEQASAPVQPPGKIPVKGPTVEPGREGGAVKAETSVVTSPKKTAVWSLVGVSGAALITGGIFGLTALDEKERYEDNPAQDFEDRQNARALAAYISFGVAGAAAVAALIVGLAVDDKGEASTADASLATDGASIIVKF